MNIQDIEKYLKSNWAEKSNEELAKYIGKSQSQLRRYARKLNLPQKEGGGSNKIEFKRLTVEELKEQKKKSDQLAHSKKNIEQLLKENSKLTKTLEAISKVKDVKTFKISKRVGSKSEATAVILASDWHVGELVDSSTIGYVNEYNKEVAKQRGEEFFANALRLIQIFEKDIEINTLILALLGDFITNTIHEDLAETNTMLPADEISFAQDLIISGIEFLLKETKLNIIIPCHSGNHGRMTKKQRTSAEAGNSLEYYMYRNIAGYFRNEKRLTFIIPRGYFSFVEVYDKVIRFHHGHNLQYGGGVGGITIPVNKAIAQWNKIRNVDFDCLSEDTEILTVNGFKKYGEIKDGDKVFNFNASSNNIEEDSVNKVIMKEYNGDMYNYKNANFDMLLTPNHRFLHKPTYKKDWIFKTAKDLSNYKSEINIPLASSIDSTVCNLKDSEIALAGWIISEGSFKTAGIRIGQLKKENIKKIKKALDGCKLDYSDNVRADGLTMFNIYKYQKDYIKSFVSDKKIPEWVKYLDDKQFDIFLDAMVSGDGNWIGKHGAGSYYSKDESIIDNLQIALTLHNRRAYKYYHKGGFKDGCWVVGFCKRKTSNYTFQRQKPEVIKYNGRVWCLNTNNGTLICRRNNKVFITGNCFGHFHQFLDGGYWICNGSMIGFNNYAESIKATFEKPKQTFFLIDAKRGKTITAPITFSN